jgi:hypothetical protein
MFSVITADAVDFHRCISAPRPKQAMFRLIFSFVICSKRARSSVPGCFDVIDARKVQTFQTGILLNCGLNNP